MSVFGRVTKGDLQDIRDAVDVLAIRLERDQRTVKGHNGRLAGLERRLRAVEEFLTRIEIGANGEVSESEEDEEYGEQGDREAQLARLRGQ